MDKQGGHTERDTGFYHCHRQPCFKIHGESGGSAVGSAPFVTLYSREQWPHWIDEDGDCQDARAEALILHSLVSVGFSDAGRCTVETGAWRDPYTGRVFHSASDLDIDHMVPLQWAHGHGGDRWPPRMKQKFANDPRNLLPVAASANRQKGAKGPGEWVPENQSYRCEYLRTFTGIAAAYGLQFVEVEKADLMALAAACHQEW